MPKYSKEQVFVSFDFSKIIIIIELRELVNMHGQEHAGPLTVDETTIIKGS
jgi:hypothetical protein